jgi:hypothetical protein
MIYFYIALSVVATFYLLWVHYLAVMHLRDVRDDGRADASKAMTPFAYKCGLVVLFIGELLDLAGELLCTFIFVDLPRELTVSGRVKRLCLTTGWRGSFARWFRDNFLSKFDRKGGHD